MPYKIYIDGAWVDAAGGEQFDSINPATGENWAAIPRGGAADVDLAVEAAQRAFEGAWGQLKPAERGRLLSALADLIEDRSGHLAEVETRDNGKLYAEMSVQTRYVASWYRYFGGLADKIEGAVVPNEKPAIFNYTRHEPLGVVALIIPWNSPLLTLALKMAAALAAGNTIVVKPSEHASASTLEFMKLVEEAGFPPGTVNAITGFGEEVGAALAAHPGIAKVSFTGSDAVGQRIYESAARNIIPISLELGGKSPNIVFEDADLDAAVIGAISGIFAASGQTCVAGSRLLLQRSIRDRFVFQLLDIAREARIGDPMLAETDVGPVATRPQYEKVLDYIEIAKAEGATCLLGGKPFSGPGAESGLFVEPTIFDDVENTMRIAQEEVFGPVLSILTFETEEEAIRIANDIKFGLAAGVWTSNIGRAFRAAEQIRAGTIWVNTYRSISYSSPFGGYKRSGIGREGGIEAIKEFMQTKSVWIASESPTENPFIIR